MMWLVVAYLIAVGVEAWLGYGPVDDPHETVLQHRLDCSDTSDVHITNGVNRQLISCRSCHAEIHVDKERPR